MIGKILGVLGVPLLLAGLIWLGAVIYFQQASTEVSSTDLVVWFGLVPLAAVTVWFVGKALHTRSQRAKESADAPAQAAGVVPAERDTALSLQLTILSAEINTAAGESAPDLIKGLRKTEIKPIFTDRLTDDSGIAVKAAVCEGIESDEHLSWVEQWLQTTNNAAALDAGQGARLLALLHGPLTRTIDTLKGLPLPPTDARTTDAAAMATMAVRQTNPENAARPLVTKVFAPPAWQEMITAYVKKQVVEAGGFAFGVVRADAGHPERQADSLRVADAFCHSSLEGYSNSILMLVACDSLTTQAHVDLLANQGLLFTPAHQGGQIPGEAAAIVLAAPAALPVDAPPLASLRRAAYGARQKPVDASGRASAELLQQLTSAALLNAGQEALSVAAVVSDCDHRSPWLTETSMLVSSAFAELDVIADHLAIGGGLGNTGHASSTLALALAAHAVAMDDKHVVVANVADVSARSVAVLGPWLEPSAVSENPAPPNLS
ncbi:MAG: hypothetical protein JWL63_300 [Rhodocyclales bacterium]|nr:hypothetical protein [Rhodocyclales bacterium]